MMLIAKSWGIDPFDQSRLPLSIDRRSGIHHPRNIAIVCLDYMTGEGILERCWRVVGDDDELTRIAIRASDGQLEHASQLVWRTRRAALQWVWSVGLLVDIVEGDDEAPLV